MGGEVMSRLAKTFAESPEGRERQKIAADILAMLLKMKLSIMDIESIFETAIFQIKDTILSEAPFVDVETDLRT